jgi:hypothetical protein
MMSALTGLRKQGSSVLSGLNTAQSEILVNLERRLSALNARRQRASRCPTVHTPWRLCLSDMLDIDQAQTTATVRVDAQSATLRERTLGTAAAIKTMRFTTDVGTVNDLGDLKRVIVEGSQLPVGTFDIELNDVLDISMLVIDMVPTPSEPAITVKVSTDGVTYKDAISVSSSGYRVSAWLPSLSVRYIRVVVAPTHPDDLGGSAWTFGITDMNAAATQFQLLSEVFSKPILITPVSNQLRFKADADDGISFFLSIADQPFVEVANGDVIDIPGAQRQVLEDVQMDDAGKLQQSLPGLVYPSSLRVVDYASGAELPIAPGLSPSAAGLSLITGKYISVLDNDMYLLRYDSAVDIGRSFTVTYAYGPSSISIRLRAQLTTLDRAATPVLRGAVLEEV